VDVLGGPGNNDKVIEILPDDIPVDGLGDDEAREFHHHVGQMMIAAACHHMDSMKSAALRTTSAFAIARPQYADEMIDHDKRQAALMRHESIMLRTGLKMGFIDALTGNNPQGNG